jgi:pimeloyl-ACP methyl ester carboxylesterase
VASSAARSQTPPKRVTTSDVIPASRRRKLFASAALVALGVASPLACRPITNRLLLFPTRDDRGLAGAERVMIDDAGGGIETIRAKSPGATLEPTRAIVLRFYGNADRADGWPASEALGFGAWPVEVWGVNYAGFGRSEGSASLAGVARAADVAFDEAAKRGLPIFVMGTSMGTTAALHLAATRDVRGVLLQNPPPLGELIRGRYGWWNLWLLAAPISWAVPSTLDSVANARRVRAPTLVLSSEKDEVVPFEYQTVVFDACAGPKERIVVEGARHNDPLPDATWTRVRDVLRQQGWK